MSYGYGRNWKPSKTAVREWLEKKENLENDPDITTSRSSAYFEVRGINYRVSGHTPEASANHIEKTNREIGSMMSDEEYNERLEKANQTRKSAQLRGVGEVQIWSAQTNAQEIKDKIEDRTFNFDNQKYFNRKEAFEILKKHGEWGENEIKDTKNLKKLNLTIYTVPDNEESIQTLKYFKDKGIEFHEENLYLANFIERYSEAEKQKLLPITQYAKGENEIGFPNKHITITGFRPQDFQKIVALEKESLAKEKPINMTLNLTKGKER